MQGGGESMTAIVQGLDSGRLAVTVMRQRCDGDNWINGQPRGSIMNCAGQFSQPCPESAPTADCASQICDDRYVSSYKSAHCQAKPSSPPVSHSEFPPLRTYPCRVEGNFEIGTYDCADNNTSSANNTNRFRRSDQLSFAKGPFYASLSAETEAFANSLRKYPSFSPESKPSTELIESLLLYTQAKNLLRNSDHLKRSHKRKELLNEKNQIRNKTSKNLQTYTRSPKNEVPTRDEGANTKKYEILNADEPSCGLHSARRDNANKRYKDDQIEYTYDYLKSISSPRQDSSRSPEVRYLTGMTRHIRDAIRQMRDDDAVVECPSIRSRFNQHQMQCQKRKSDVQTGPESTNSGVQATCTKCTRGISYSTPPIGICQSPARFCCLCQKPMPCACRISRLSKSLSPRYSEQETNYQKSAQSFENKIEESIFSWLKEIPVYANENPEDKALRAEKIKMLADNLKKLFGDEQFTNKAKAEIDKCIASLPMWCPNNSFENLFRNKITNNLLQKIGGVPTNEEKSSELETKILDLLVDIPELSEYIGRDHVKSLAKKLEEMKSKGLEDEDFKEQMHEETKKWLESVLLEKCVNMELTLKNEIAENLTNHLIPSQTPMKHKYRSEEDDLQETILEKVSDIIEKCNLNINSNEKKNIANKITNILTRNIDAIKSFQTYKIEEEIVTVFKKEANLHGEKAKELTDTFINKIKSMIGLKSDKTPIIASTSMMSESNAKKSVSSPITLENDVKKFINTEEFNASKTIANDIEGSLIDIIADQILRGINVNKSRVEMFDVLQNTKEQTEDILVVRRGSSSSLTGLTKELSIISKHHDSHSKEALFGQVRKPSQSFSSHDFSFHPNKDAMSTVLSPIEDDEDFSAIDEKNYAKELARVMSCWINELPIDLNLTGGVNFKDTMVKDLVSDIIDRQKYLQLNPEAKTSDVEELEHLKYQLFRWLSKILDVNDLTPLMAKTELLKTKLEDTPVPKLVKHCDQIQEMKETQYLEPNDYNALQNIISLWFDDILSELYRSSDASHRQQLIKELADKIYNLRTSKSNPEMEMRNEIIQWLHKTIKEINSDNLSIMVDKLIHRFTNKNSDEHSSMVTKDNSEFIEDNVKRSKLLINKLTNKKTNESPSILIQGNSDRHNISNRLNWSSSRRDKDSTSNNEHGIRPLIPFDPKGNLPIGREEVLASNKEDGIKSIPTNDSRGNSSIRRDNVLNLSNKNEIKPMSNLDSRGISPNKRDKPLGSNNKNTIRSTPIIDLNSPSKRDEALTSNVEDVIKLLPTVDSSKGFTQIKHLNALVGDLISRVKQLTRQYDPSSPEFKQIIKEEIKKCLQTLPLEGLMTLDNGFLKQKVEDLLSVQVPVENRITINETESPEPTSTIQYSARNSFQEEENSVSSKPASKTKLTSVTSYIDTEDVKKLIEKTKYIPKISLDKPDNVGFKSITEIDQTSKIVSNETRGRSILEPQHSPTPLFIEEKVTEEPITGTRQAITSKPIPKTKEIVISESLPKTRQIVESTFLEPESFTSSKTTLKTAMDILYERIENWCEELPLTGKTAGEIETNKIIKHNMIHKLMLQITQLNMDPEILNDDFLYEDLLKDGVDKLISVLPIDTELQTGILSLIPKLIEKVKEVKQKVIEELLVKAYKQKLRDSISKTLPSPVITSCNKQASFEVLKENLADAFVNLHYSIDNEKLKRKFRVKIFNEVNRFCKDYLKTCPGSPIDTRKLNHNLYNALAMVPVPDDESMLMEVKQLRLKDIINDWVIELPLKRICGKEKLQINKLVSVLGRRIYELEHDIDSNPESDSEDQIEREVLRWLKKIPLKTSDNMKELAEKLITRLKNTEESRKLDITAINDSLHFLKETTCPYRKSTLERKKLVRSSCECISENMTSYPASSLNTDEKAHLQKIRERTSVHKTSKPCRDTSVSPLSIDSCCQTDIEAYIDQPSPEIVCPNSRTSSCERTDQAEVSPNVIIKQYLWNSTHSLKNLPPCQPQNMTSQRSPTQSPERHASPKNSEPCSPPKTLFKQTLPCEDNRPCTSTPCKSRTFIKSRDSSRQSYCKSPKTVDSFSHVHEESPDACLSIRQIPTKKVCGSLENVEKNVVDRTSANVEDDIKKVSRDNQKGRHRRKCIDFNLPTDNDLGTGYLMQKCSCKNRTLLKCRSKKHREVCYRQTSKDDLKFCPKCCGQHCPHPSYMYFS